ncbi:MAG: hypothetical protein ACFFG0_00620 [Candidatus Thorarchaeota archaeon]
MKNPCEECLIKVNCTKVCLDKTNYGILLKNALNSFRTQSDLNKTYRKEYDNYLDLWLLHKQNLTTINYRRNRHII